MRSIIASRKPRSRSARAYITVKIDRSNFGECETYPNAAANQASSVCVKVTVSYPYAAHPLIPTLPGLGFVVPSTISSVYEVQVL